MHSKLSRRKTTALVGAEVVDETVTVVGVWQAVGLQTRVSAAIVLLVDVELLPIACDQSVEGRGQNKCSGLFDARTFAELNRGVDSDMYQCIYLLFYDVQAGSSNQP